MARSSRSPLMRAMLSAFSRRRVSSKRKRASASFLAMLPATSGRPMRNVIADMTTP